MILERIFGASESLCSYDTYQFEDYSKVFAPRFNPEKKAQRRREVFPLDCTKAFEMGVRLVGIGAQSIYSLNLVAFVSEGKPNI